MVFDSGSGVVKNTNQATSTFGNKVRNWLYKNHEETWKLPVNPVVGISLAIAGHSLWNGSSILVSNLFASAPLAVMVIANLAWTLVMIGALFYVGREILASVMHLP